MTARTVDTYPPQVYDKKTQQWIEDHTAVERLDRATIDLIFALRDSLTDDGPDLIKFWDNRAVTAITAAAAGSDTAGQAITTAAHKVQILTFTKSASAQIVKIATIIDADYQAWAEHVGQRSAYIMALARNENRTKKEARKAAAQKADTTTNEEPKF